jgi:hypothetical protein
MVDKIWLQYRYDGAENRVFPNCIDVDFDKSEINPMNLEPVKPKEFYATYIALQEWITAHYGPVTDGKWSNVSGFKYGVCVDTMAMAHNIIKSQDQILVMGKLMFDWH